MSFADSVLIVVANGRPPRPEGNLAAGDGPTGRRALRAQERGQRSELTRAPLTTGGRVQQEAHQRHGKARAGEVSGRWPRRASSVLHEGRRRGSWFSGALAPSAAASPVTGSVSCRHASATSPARSPCLHPGIVYPFPRVSGRKKRDTRIACRVAAGSARLLPVRAPPCSPTKGGQHPTPPACWANAIRLTSPAPGMGWLAPRVRTF